MSKFGLKPEIILGMLDFEGITRIADAMSKRAQERGHGHFAWRDPPSEDVSREQADATWKAKLDGAYSERALAYVGMLIPVVGQGYEVRFVQFVEEAGLPFDAAGWTAIAVGGAAGFWTILHLSPGDFDADGFEDIVELVDKNDPENGFIAYDDLQPTKPAEYSALLQAARCACPDIIETIRELSKAERNAAAAR